MTLAAKKLLGLTVATKSGQKLGRVADYMIDLDSQSILLYEVRPGLVSRRNTLLIHRSQVLSISEDKMVVEDALVAEKAGEKQTRLAAGIAPSPTPNLTNHDLP